MGFYFQDPSVSRCPVCFSDRQATRIRVHGQECSDAWHLTEAEKDNLDAAKNSQENQRKRTGSVVVPYDDAVSAAQKNRDGLAQAREKYQKDALAAASEQRRAQQAAFEGNSGVHPDVAAREAARLRNLFAAHDLKTFTDKLTPEQYKEGSDAAEAICRAFPEYFPDNLNEKNLFSFVLKHKLVPTFQAFEVCLRELVAHGKIERFIEGPRDVEKRLKAVAERGITDIGEAVTEAERIKDMTAKEYADWLRQHPDAEEKNRAAQTAQAQVASAMRNFIANTPSFIADGESFEALEAECKRRNIGPHNLSVTILQEIFQSLKAQRKIKFDDTRLVPDMPLSRR